MIHFRVNVYVWYKIKVLKYGFFLYMFCGNVLGTVLFFKKDCFSVSYVTLVKFYSPEIVVFDYFVQFYVFILLSGFANFFILPNPEYASVLLFFNGVGNSVL